MKCYSIIFFTVIGLILGCGESCPEPIPRGYKLFEPIEFGPNGGYINPGDASQDFTKNLKLVLEYYEEDFVVACKKIYVRGELFGDKEMMTNYYSKAEQSNWLETIYKQNQ